MEKDRLAAFSDGVIAIIITIMVLELKPPQGSEWSDLRDILPECVSYVLSFVYVAIYWNNHHHLLHTAQKVNGAMLWANMHLLFWLSLIPLTTDWLWQSHFAAAPTAMYGVILLMAAVAYYVLQRTIICIDPSQSLLKQALGKDLKGKMSPLLYISAIILSFFSPLMSQIIYVGVALMWLVPDKRIEKVVR